MTVFNFLLNSAVVNIARSFLVPYYTQTPNRFPDFKNVLANMKWSSFSDDYGWEVVDNFEKDKQ